MVPGACAPVAGVQVQAAPRVRLWHASAVTTLIADRGLVSAAAADGEAGVGAAAGAGGGTAALGSGAGVAAAVSVAAGSGWRTGSAAAGDGEGGGACDDAGGGAATVDGGGVDAVRSCDGFEPKKYHPPTISRNSIASTAATAGARDGSRVAAGALSVRGDTATADDERNGKSSSDGGAAARGGAAFGAATFGAAAFGAAGFGGAGGGAGRGGGADEADDVVANVVAGADEAAGAGADEAAGAGADEAVGAGDDVAGGGDSLSGTPRAVQNCSRFSRLVVTNGSLAGRLAVAMA